jgi:tol-pal system protein YbgF
MTVLCTDRNTALLVRAVLFSATAVIACATSSLASAQAPIIDSTQSRSTYGQSQSSANTDYGAASQLQQLQQEVMQLRGMVEEQAFQIQQLQQRQQELESRSGQSSSAIAPPADQREIPAAIPEDNTDAAAPVSAPIATDMGDEDAYRAAYNLIKAQKFDQAVGAFQNFVKTYPGSRYEPNAYYWLGELYLQIQDLDASREAYTNLVEKYPDNTKVADARYKLAKVHFLKGEKSKSRDLLKNVIASYPGTATAQAAQKFLKENF